METANQTGQAHLPTAHNGPVFERPEAAAIDHPQPRPPRDCGTRGGRGTDNGKCRAWAWCDYLPREAGLGLG